MINMRIKTSSSIKQKKYYIHAMNTALIYKYTPECVQNRWSTVEYSLSGYTHAQHTGRTFMYLRKLGVRSDCVEAFPARISDLWPNTNCWEAGKGHWLKWIKSRNPNEFLNSGQ